MSLGDSLSVYAQGLLIQSRRAEVLASNLANADTPGYKARDLDFRAALEDALGSSNAEARPSHPRHLPIGDKPDSEMLYRVPTQPSLDGNTVESQVEQSAFAENAVRYQASLRFLDGALKTMLTAVRGD